MILNKQTNTESRWPADEVSWQTAHVRQCAASKQYEGRLQGAEADQGGKSTSPLRAHLSHLIILRLLLCARILGNLPPTKESALASAWEEYGAMERKSKAKGDRGRWKTGRQSGQRGRAMEQVAVFTLHSCVDQHEQEELRVKQEGREIKWDEGGGGRGGRTCASCSLSICEPVSLSS